MLIVSKIYTNTWFIVPHHHLVGSHIVFRKRSNKERLGETVREEEMKENIKLFTAIFSPLRLLFPTPHKPHAWMLDTCLDLYLFNFRILLRPLPPHSNIIHRLSRFHLYFFYLHSYWTQIAILWIRRAHTADIVTATERGYMWIHCEWKYFAVHILFSPHTIWNCGRRRRRCCWWCLVFFKPLIVFIVFTRAHLHPIHCQNIENYYERGTMYATHFF